MSQSPVDRSSETVVVEGYICEAGNIDMGLKRGDPRAVGVVIEVAAAPDVEVRGLSKNTARVLAGQLRRRVRLTIEPCGEGWTMNEPTNRPSNPLDSQLPTPDEIVMLREAYAETYPVRPLLNEIERLQGELNARDALDGEWQSEIDRLTRERDAAYASQRMSAEVFEKHRRSTPHTHETNDAPVDYVQFGWVPFHDKQGCDPDSYVEREEDCTAIIDGWRWVPAYAAVRPAVETNDGLQVGTPECAIKGCGQPRSGNHDSLLCETHWALHDAVTNPSPSNGKGDPCA